MRTLGPKYCATRMIDDYVSQVYAHPRRESAGNSPIVAQPIPSAAEPSGGKTLAS
jgi:hypothetical protein